MAEGNAASRYVKLRKEQAPVEDITPGELNQPIDVPQVVSLSLRTFLANSDPAPSTISSDLYPDRDGFRFLCGFDNRVLVDSDC